MKLSIGGFLVPVPGSLVRFLTRREAARWARRRAKLTPLQRKLHAVVVRELPGSHGSLPAQTIADVAKEPLASVTSALENLQTWLGFIALDQNGAVDWAYPMTVAANSPHHLAFESGERMTGA